MDNTTHKSEPNDPAMVKYQGPKINTEFWAKPISCRYYDWSATFENYEPGCPIGYGATESAAIHDLINMVE